jgi:hypothetical protein
LRVLVRRLTATQMKAQFDRAIVTSPIETLRIDCVIVGTTIRRHQLRTQVTQNGANAANFRNMRGVLAMDFRGLPTIPMRCQTR